MIFVDQCGPYSMVLPKSKKIVFIKLTTLVLLVKHFHTAEHGLGIKIIALQLHYCCYSIHKLDPRLLASNIMRGFSEPNLP